jgi:hypothetical protein
VDSLARVEALIGSPLNRAAIAAARLEVEAGTAYGVILARLVARFGSAASRIVPGVKVATLKEWLETVVDAAEDEVENVED